MSTPISELASPGKALSESLEAIQAGIARLEATAGTLESLTEIRTTLGAIRGALDTEKQRPDPGLVIADMRDSVIEEISVVQRRLEEVQQRLLQPPLPHGRPWWQILLGGVLIGAALVGGAWWGWPANRLTTFALDLDQVLTQAVGQCPKGAQESINTVYGKHQLQAPGLRQKGTR
jgi:hypothetical protein